MLERLHLQGVGPSPELHFELGSRLNILTGDNGVGKSFVLDVAWWALTRTWAGYPVTPRRSAEILPRIRFTYRSGEESLEEDYTFERPVQKWFTESGSLEKLGIVIYARADGGFSIWDPARNSSSESAVDVPPEAYHFDTGQVWDGLREGDKHLCNGLIADWVAWQRERGPAFQQLASALEVLAPSEGEPLRPGKPMRVSLGDIRDIPTLEMPYGPVPIVHASAGMRRIAALAYLLVWTWQEHQHASELLGREPTTEITFLIDEIEAHLHPRWQRVILPALLKVVDTVTQTESAQVQTLVATHAPLLLASIEPMFDEEVDRVFTFELEEQRVVVQEVPWAKQGDAVGWLVSSTFGLKQARSREAERAIEAAEAFMRKETASLPPGLGTWQEIQQELQRVLAAERRSLCA